MEQKKANIEEENLTRGSGIVNVRTHTEYWNLFEFYFMVQ